LRFSLLVACAILAAKVARSAADRVKELQAHFDQETHAGSKVKILDKLGEAQFAAATHAQQASDFNDIGLISEKYRDNVRVAFEVLKKQEPNADKHPDSYRHLELQTRRGIREVDELIVIVPGDVRPPLEIVKEDLIKMDDEMIHLLFPSRTTQPSSPPSAKEEKP
jgi:hypothetical protein